MTFTLIISGAQKFHCVFNQRKEKEQKDKEAKRKAQEAHKAKKEADRMFSGREKLRAQRLTEDRRELKAFNMAQMVTLKMFAPFMRTVISEPLGLKRR